MQFLKPVKGPGFKYDHLIGTGGIGSGIFFRLFGNHTIGRNESRAGDLLPNKDYCKLHIITHYLASLLGTPENRFRIFPIGKIGDDNIGTSLFEEMKNTGMDMTNVKKSQYCSTLFSVCFQYPDYTGGNITSANSASSKITKEDIELFFREFKEKPGKEIILSVPEVPLEPRLKLLEFGRLRGSFNAASVSSFEIEEFNSKNGFNSIDLLAINIDEARTIASLYENEKSNCKRKSISIKSGKTDFSTNKTIKNHINSITANKDINVLNILKSCINFLIDKNPGIKVAITDGPNGSYGYSNGKIEFTPVIDLDVKATAGAGDAFLAGILAGLCCGLNFLKEKKESIFTDTVPDSALELGSLMASLSVTSHDTINHKIDAIFIKEFLKNNNIVLGADFRKIF